MNTKKDCHSGRGSMIKSFMSSIGTNGCDWYITYILMTDAMGRTLVLVFLTRSSPFLQLFTLLGTTPIMFTFWSYI